jgi:hypothetical protein
MTAQVFSSLSHISHILSRTSTDTVVNDKPTDALIIQCIGTDYPPTCFGTLTLCCSYLNPYCLGRKTAFFSVGIKIFMQNQKQESHTGKKIITIKLKKTEW